jgi:restriction system protein
MAARGFASIIHVIAKETARAQRKADAERKRQLREQERTARRAALDNMRALAKWDKEARQRYLEARAQEVGQLNEGLSKRIGELRTILQQTLKLDDTIDFESLRLSMEDLKRTLPRELTDPSPPPSRFTFTSAVPEPGFLGRLLPWKMSWYRARLRQAEVAYEAALKKQHQTEIVRKQKLAEATEAILKKVDQRNQEVDELEKAYREGQVSAVVAYSTMVLERSQYPEGFQQEFRVAYAPESKELVVEYELPKSDVVPKVAEYRYVKTRDEVEEKERKTAEMKDIYQDVVAAIALRTIHEVFEADQGNHIAVVAFNGLVRDVDRATGKDIRPCLISVRVTKERFCELDLSRVDKRACLRNLGAQVSPQPTELVAVKPVIEFDMVDKRFVDQQNVLEDLESRPNLLDLNPFEFENLVSNLFTRMGLETKQTRSSRDGGVDAIAFDARPILGGKVVIQAKRYKDTVGVAAVRDLYGTMINEGASKGILVTTSGYGADAYDFASDKPIELIDGGGLLYLLEQVGTKARIVFPVGSD